MLQVPGSQGNWWPALAGAPFFLAFPMIWLHLRSPASKQIFTMVAISLGATVAVETPFILHLAGTGEWQRLVILCLGFGIIILSGAGLFFRRRWISSARACLVGLSTAYLANAALCLVVSGNPKGP